MRYQELTIGDGDPVDREAIELASGPYVEAPEYLGGLWVIDAADQDAAVAWAAKASKALRSRIEVRAVQEAPTGEEA